MVRKVMLFALLVLVIVAVNSLHASDSDKLCAKIELRNPRCGFVQRGKFGWVQNKLNDKKVRVTVLIERKRGNETGEEQKVYRLPAGGSRNMGCTVSSGIDYITSRFSVIGCEPF